MERSIGINANNIMKHDFDHAFPVIVIVVKSLTKVVFVLSIIICQMLIDSFPVIDLVTVLLSCPGTTLSRKNWKLVSRCHQIYDNMSAGGLTLSNIIEI